MQRLQHVRRLSCLSPPKSADIISKNRGGDLSDLSLRQRTVAVPSSMIEAPSITLCFPRLHSTHVSEFGFKKIAIYSHSFSFAPHKLMVLRPSLLQLARSNPLP